MATSTSTEEEVKRFETPEGMVINRPYKEKFAAILTMEALTLIAELHRKFNSTRYTLLENRKKVQENIDNGIPLGFLPETKDIREGDWTVDPVPADLQDRRVEITGPVDRKMVINALNSGAKMFMADFEDSNSPKWTNNIGGQINMKDAIRKTITFKNKAGKKYELNDEIATLLIRPRGGHLLEKHIIVDG